MDTSMGGLCSTEIVAAPIGNLSRRPMVTSCHICQLFMRADCRLLMLFVDEFGRRRPCGSHDARRWRAMAHPGVVTGVKFHLRLWFCDPFSIGTVWYWNLWKQRAMKINILLGLESRVTCQRAHLRMERAQNKVCKTKSADFAFCRHCTTLNKDCKNSDFFFHFVRCHFHQEDISLKAWEYCDPSVSKYS